MRLLHRRPDGELDLVEHLSEDNLPPYAILSHVWSGDEVTFQDIIGQTGKEKSGYRKIVFFLEQAHRDGLEYCWVDSCCIDQSDSVERSESINSMHHWYRGAQKCYVYLEDVSCDYGQLDGPEPSISKSDLSRSRWFTRAWTVQELIAPRILEFFSVEGYRLGDRSLIEDIDKTTSLPPRALQGHSLSKFSLKERLSWPKDRRTAGSEDESNSLLVTQVLEESKMQSFVLVHELAARDQSFEHLKNIWTGVDTDLKSTIEKVAEFDESTEKWRLKKVYWKELDVWDYEYEDPRDRQSAIDNAIKVYDRARVTLSDAAWDRLLPPEDRGKSIVLSKQQSSIAATQSTASKTPAHERVYPENENSEPKENEDSEFEDIESIFSDSGLSMSSKSSVELNPVRISGIREITRVLLSREEFESLCTAAIANVAAEKSRAHIRGFLKNYGQQLAKEAHSPLQHQAARFVREVAGRIADELRWSIKGFEGEMHPEATEGEKPDLEKWLSGIEHGWNNDKNPTPVDDDGSHSDESEDDPDIETAFPNIDAVSDFLLSSNAFETLIQVLDSWINTKKHPTLSARRRASPASQSGEAIDPDNVASQEDRLLEDASAASGKVEGSIVNDSVMESGRHSAGGPRSIRTPIPGGVSLSISFSTVDMSISFSFLDGRTISIHPLELFAPPVPPGVERIRWRCSCNSILWGDFPLDNPNALTKLKEDLLKDLSPTTNNLNADYTGDRPSQQPSGLSGGHVSPSHERIDRSYTTSQTPSSTASSSFNGGQKSDRSGLALGAGLPSNATGKQPESLTQVVVDRGKPIYFEVCTNVGNSAVGHFELDITQITTDGGLFKEVWKIYAQSHGFGLRRLFLRPRDVHFVLFSINSRPAARYSAGIHKKPQEYPPDAELQQRRYHYLTPKIIMPSNIFIHFLHRARLNVRGGHANDTWLKRLPKKLNESLLAAQVMDPDPDLVFGWGIHILDGPNHANLGMLLSFGLLITFVVSCLILGIAKTQEQAFGVGQYLLAIMVAFMSAVYFKLQDQ
ncbi:heterokaryon incompatibility protein-domain-containing protein [Xylaria digitata]|nr:heterokaryon incompatibility protein-domain-containing protein [Xylaria digitata]